MSADLLRRAAAKLRERAEAAAAEVGFFADAPWTVEEDDDAEATLYVVADRPDMHTTAYIGEGFLSRAHADFVALMHPPVALALVELLDKAALLLESAEREGWGDVYEDDPHPILALARAILREEES